MQYRKMPKSDDKLSVLGYGCMRFPTKFGGIIDREKAIKQIRLAIDNGVNYLDTAWIYHFGASESFLGEHVLKDGYREKVNIATKLPCMFIKDKEKIQQIFDKQLQKLNVDYIDYYLLHSLNGASWDKMLEMDIINFMNKIRKEGKVRHMGFSFHGRYEDFVRIVDGYDWDFAQVQYNILDENYQAGNKGVEYAASKDLGIIVMEPLRGGALAGKIPKEVQEIYNKALIKRSAVDWALRWIYNNPAVTLVLSGMNNEKHINENIRIASESMPNGLSKEELAIINSVKDKYLELMQVGCTGCGYCMPCPAGINIPQVFKNLNNFHMFGKIDARIQHMLHTDISSKDGKMAWTSKCLNCGKCEQACPQNIEVRKVFKEVQKDLEGNFTKAFGMFLKTVTGKKKRR